MKKYSEYGQPTTYGKSFRYYRNKTAKKLGDQTIRTIKLYHLRHYYATMLLKKTNNLIIVKMKLGHHNINHTIKYSQVLDIECEIINKKTFQYLIPVRFYAWEGYHSEINQAGSAMVLAKEPATYFDLCLQPQNFNFYKKNGNLASITFQSGNLEQRSRQFLLFLRKDLLDEYLEKNEVNLIWIIWDEREFASKSIEELQRFQKNNKSFGSFI